MGTRTVNYPFLTQKERDIETGLDYFLARYYSSKQGRFTSVDPDNADADIEFPQSWNGYAYARNNPVFFTDRNGKEITICGPDGKSNCYTHKNKEFASLRKHCETTGDCKILDDRLTGGRIVQNGEVIATFANELDDGPGGELVRQLNDDEVWNRAAVAAIFNVTVGKVLGKVRNVVRGKSAQTTLPGLPKSAQKPLGRGHSQGGRSVPNNVKEQLAMEQAIANPAAGQHMRNIVMTDPRWPVSQGWIKMRQNINGVEVHYVRNTRTGEIDDF